MAATDPTDLPYRPCAGIVLINSEGLIWAGRRLDSETRAPNAWQMPQGGIDKGEDPEAAAFREMEEEIGTRNARLLKASEGWLKYDLPTDLLGYVWKGKYRGQKQKWFALSYEGTDNDINIQTEDPEFSEWKWMSASELLTCTVEFKRDVYVQVFKEFQELIS